MAATTSQPNYGPATKKMKLEHENGAANATQAASTTPSTSSAATTTTAPGYATTTSQWSTTQIPIDPALTQPTMQPQPATHVMSYSHYQPYGATTAHYTQTPYGNHFHSYQPPATQPAVSTSTALPPAPMPVSRQPTQTNEVDTTDIATLNDALGSAGVDLRAEEETLQRSQDHHTMFRTYEDRSRKQASNLSFDSSIVGSTMRSIGSQHKVSRIPDDSVTYVALALRTRLQGLIKSMIAAADHRMDSQFDRPPGLYEDGTPMWSVVVRRDTRKMLEVLERVEREEEMRIRRERKEKSDAAAAQAASQAAQVAGTSNAEGAGSTPGPGSTDEQMDTTPPAPVKKPKKKKEGPGVTAKNMSEEVQKRMSNAVATRGLGLTKYAWMNAGSLAASSPPKPKTSVATKTTGDVGVTPAGKDATTAAPGTSTGTAANPTTPAASSSTWVKPYVPAAAKAAAAVSQENEKRTVTMRDAMFVIEGERGHGAGRGAARAWV